MNSKTKGFIYGAIAAASYGMNPLFTLPLYAAGMSVDTVLFYRYFFAVIVLGILMKMQHQSFALRKADILPLVIMGLLFSFSSSLLFMSYNYMDAGIASTILFVYPVMVTVIMGAFFKEKISAITVFSITGSRRHCPALSGRRRQTVVYHWNHLCPAIIAILCHIYSRCQPLDTEKPIDNKTHFLRYFVRSVGLHRPSELPDGFASDTYRVALGRCIGTGYPAYCRITGLHSIGYPLHRFHSDRHTGGSGTCDRFIFRCPSVSRKADTPLNGRYFDDYYSSYPNHHR